MDDGSRFQCANFSSNGFISLNAKNFRRNNVDLRNDLADAILQVECAKSRSLTVSLCRVLINMHSVGKTIKIRCCICL